MTFYRLIYKLIYLRILVRNIIIIFSGLIAYAFFLYLFNNIKVEQDKSITRCHDIKYKNVYINIFAYLISLVVKKEITIKIKNIQG